ncbi:MAG: FKBP-type peptidyl-prolyl cis-trans isomerase [Thermoanaerobaculia bacterium]|nr:FKBP-type peptidyl-prolyl cis-trans isomerase [Thermoanaerobaculia bacterium]
MTPLVHTVTAALLFFALPSLAQQRPAEDDYVRLRYEIRKEDGKVVDRTPDGLSNIMQLARMMPGWRDVVAQMIVGEKRSVTISADESGGKIPAGQTYVIDTELLEIIDGPATPADLTAPPSDAMRTKSGLSYRVLREGSGTEHPKRRSKVLVHYSGWTTDGRLFDSSILRGKPAEFRVDNVIAGWTEGLQLMTAGERRRFWIPAKLAYPKDPGKPQGTLVFDIELVAIK